MALKGEDAVTTFMSKHLPETRGRAQVAITSGGGEGEGDRKRRERNGNRRRGGEETGGIEEAREKGGSWETEVVRRRGAEKAKREERSRKQRG